MNTKEQILQGLDKLSEPSLEEVLKLVRQLETQTPEGIDPEVWAAYQAPKQKRQEVYRRLANS